MNNPVAADRPLTLFLRLAAALIVGGGAGVAAILLTYHQMGRIPGSDDVAYSLGGGSACLVIGIIICFAFHPVGALARFRPLLVALLLGTGVALSTLGFFWWLQRAVFAYRQYPDLNYLLGEVGGYSGPGLGLMTCALVLVWSYFAAPDNGQRSRSGAGLHMSLPAVSPPQHGTLGFLLRLVLASIVGASAGLLGGAMTYMLLGTRGPTSELAGFMACGLGCLTAGITFLLLCFETDSLTWLSWVGVVAFLLSGLVLCGMGVLNWLP
jgi:hypothetical protein